MIYIFCLHTKDQSLKLCLIVLPKHLGIEHVKVSVSVWIPSFSVIVLVPCVIFFSSILFLFPVLDLFLENFFLVLIFVWLPHFSCSILGIPHCPFLHLLHPDQADQDSQEPVWKKFRALTLKESNLSTTFYGKNIIVKSYFLPYIFHSISIQTFYKIAAYLVRTFSPMAWYVSVVRCYFCGTPWPSSRFAIRRTIMKLHILMEPWPSYDWCRSVRNVIPNIIFERKFTWYLNVLSTNSKTLIIWK